MALRYGSAVSRLLVTGNRVSGVELAGGEQIAASAVIFNGDAQALAQGLLGEPTRRALGRTAQHQRSLSALTWNLVTPARGFPLLRHTVFFSGDYGREFNTLLGQRRLPQDPTVYICAHDRSGDGTTGVPGGPERLLRRAEARP